LVLFSSSSRGSVFSPCKLALVSQSHYQKKNLSYCKVLYEIGICGWTHQIFEACHTLLSKSLRACIPGNYEHEYTLAIFFVATKRALGCANLKFAF
jgi:hypothetical protein